jgi:hypothetical protein
MPGLDTRRTERLALPHRVIGSFQRIFLDIHITKWKLGQVQFDSDRGDSLWVSRCFRHHLRPAKTMIITQS